MEEGNPALALVRKERVVLPPVLYIQGVDDIVHPRKDLDRFVVNYHQAGGHLELALFENAAEGFLIQEARLGGGGGGGQENQRIREGAGGVNGASERLLRLGKTVNQGARQWQLMA